MDRWWLPEDVREMLASMRAGTVLAVWDDGSLTVENFSFWARRLPDGSYVTPVTTFVAGGRLPTVQAIEERVRLALDRRRGRQGPWKPVAG